MLRSPGDRQPPEIAEYQRTPFADFYIDNPAIQAAHFSIFFETMTAGLNVFHQL